MRLPRGRTGWHGLGDARAVRASGGDGARLWPRRGAVAAQLRWALEVLKEACSPWPRETEEEEEDEEGRAYRLLLAVSSKS